MCCGIQIVLHSPKTDSLANHEYKSSDNRLEAEVLIPAHKKVKIKAGKEMEAEVLKLTPKPTKKAP